MLLFNGTTLGITCAIANHHIDDYGSQWAVSLLCMVAKFNCTVSFYFYYLQAIEIFPTCIRNSGIGFVGFVAAIFGLSGPHITGLGAKDKRIPLGVMGLINLTAAAAASFIPETADCDLPETVKAASEYGQDQPYFSYINCSTNRNLSEKPPAEHTGKVETTVV